MRRERPAARRIAAMLIGTNVKIERFAISPRSQVKNLPLTWDLGLL
jgi:hypothetical protein